MFREAARGRVGIAQDGVCERCHDGVVVAGLGDQQMEKQGFAGPRECGTQPRPHRVHMDEIMVPSQAP
jgi:hypothetical protein